MPVSLIVTTKNEANDLPRLLDSIAQQKRLPQEIVVVDGGSTDRTLRILQAYSTRLPLKIISQPGANISQGRNAAIRAATGDLVCSTDAGVRLDPAWLAELVRPFKETGADVVSGFFVPDPCSIFETALAATTLPALEDIRPQSFLPSSRSIAFRKEAWEKVNGYPEWLDYCEDLIFDFALRAAGYGFAFAPRAIAHFRPRSSLGAFFKQYYRYARGDGKADLWLKRHLLRYATYLIALPLVLALTFASPLLAIPCWLLGALALFATPYKRLFRSWTDLQLFSRLGAAAWIPVIRITGDVAKMVGYPVGVWWRMKHGGSVRAEGAR